MSSRDPAAPLMSAVEKPGPEQVQLAQRLFVALVEERNLMAQQYGEFPYEPVKPMDAWNMLRDVANQEAW